MMNFTQHFEEYNIWKKGVELAEKLQGLSDAFSDADSRDLRSRLRKMSISIPYQLAEGFMSENIKDRKLSFYRVLDNLEEILRSFVFTEGMACMKRPHIHKIQRDICELNAKLREILRPQERIMS